MPDRSTLRREQTCRPLAAALGAFVLICASACAREGQAAAPEALTWFTRYLEIDTTNPPGREEQAAALLRNILHSEGISTRLLVSPAGRTSLYAKLEPSSPTGGALVLTHHMDVVPAGSGWSVDPFAAVESEGRIWGRGSIDVKSLGIAQLAAFVDLHRHGGPEGRPVIYLAVADEETGGAEGTRWLLEHHADLFSDVAAVLGEGGANRVISETHLWWGIEIAQKRPLWLRATVHGRGGHGSMYNPASAPHQLTAALARLLERPRDFRVTPEARRYLEAAAPLQGAGFQEIVERLDEIVAAEEPETKLFPGIANYLVDTIQVNVVETGERINVVPREASAMIDVRLLPDVDEQVMLEEIQSLLGDRIHLETLLRAPRTAGSPVDHEIYRCLEKELLPAAVIPAFIAGVTDSRYYRERGIPAYGFSPFSLDGLETRGIHAADEWISREAFLAGVEIYTKVIRRCSAYQDPPA